MLQSYVILQLLQRNANNDIMQIQDGASTYTGQCIQSKGLPVNGLVRPTGWQKQNTFSKGPGRAESLKYSFNFCRPGQLVNSSLFCWGENVTLIIQPFRQNKDEILKLVKEKIISQAKVTVNMNEQVEAGSSLTILVKTINLPQTLLLQMLSLSWILYIFC